MKGEIKEIKRKEIAATADASLVALFEELLINAREGKITSVIGVFMDDHIPIPFTCVDLGDELNMLGAIEVLKDAYKLEHLSDVYEEMEYE